VTTYLLVVVSLATTALCAWSWQQGKAAHEELLAASEQLMIAQQDLLAEKARDLEVVKELNDLREDEPKLVDRYEHQLRLALQELVSKEDQVAELTSRVASLEKQLGDRPGGR
jgi:hypothetical protein